MSEYTLRFTYAGLDITFSKADGPWVRAKGHYYEVANGSAGWRSAFEPGEVGVKVDAAGFVMGQVPSDVFPDDKSL